MEKEIWKKTPDYKDYEFSNLGNVKSLKFGKEKILKQRLNRNGYKVINLLKNGVQKTYEVHQLIAIAFLNHKPCGLKLVINHKNFVRDDNRVENLEITTQRENANLKHIPSTSSFVGVYFNKYSKKWQSQILINRKTKHLGYFKNEFDAHLAYQSELSKIIGGNHTSQTI